MAHHTLLSPPHMERGGTHQNSAYYCVYKYIERSLHLFYLYIYIMVCLSCIISCIVYLYMYIYIYLYTYPQTIFRPFLCSLSHVDTPHVPHHSVASPTPLLSQPCVDGMIGLHPRNNTRIPSGRKHLMAPSYIISRQSIVEVRLGNMLIVYSLIFEVLNHDSS